MKVIFFVALVVTQTEVFSQFRPSPIEHYNFGYSILPTSEKTFIHGLISDPVQSVRQVPMLTNLGPTDYRAQNNFAWVGTITTMSFNKGKFGTLYYWDIHGDLQGARGFIDISGKNKRGVKLVFPWRKF